MTNQLPDKLDEILIELGRQCIADHWNQPQATLKAKTALYQLLLEARESMRKEIRDSLLQANIQHDGQHYSLTFSKELLVELLGEKALEKRTKQLGGKEL